MNQLNRNLTNVINELQQDYLKFDDTIRTIEVLSAINNYFHTTEETPLSNKSRDILKEIKIYGK
jgi:hypothetical protein